MQERNGQLEVDIIQARPDGQARLQDTARWGGAALLSARWGVEVWEDVLRGSWV